MNKKTMPFDLFTALKIQAGITKGRFVTRFGQVVQIVCWNKAGDYPIVGLKETGYTQTIDTYTLSGKFRTEKSPFDLLIELDEEGEK